MWVQTRQGMPFARGHLLESLISLLDIRGISGELS